MKAADALKLATAVVAAAACDSRRTDPVVSPAPVQLVETLRIGSIDEPDRALTRIGGILPMSDGGVWVVQPEDAEARVFSADGALVRRVGGRGEGPGEFTFPGAIGWWAPGRDSVWIADPFLGRISIFGLGGEVGRTIAAPPVSLGDTLVIDQPDAFTPDGHALALATYTPRADEWGRFPIVSYDPAGSTAPRQIASIGRTSLVQIRWRGDALGRGAHPVPDAPLLRLTHDGRVIIVVRDAMAGAPVRIIALNAPGDTLWTREYARELSQIPETEIDSIYTAQIARFQSFARLEGRVSDDDAAAAYRASVRIPEHRPPVRQVVAAVDGRLWLQWSAAPGESTEWWVLDASGAPVVQFSSPAALDARAAAGDALWVAETDSMGVPYVLRYELRGP